MPGSLRLGRISFRLDLMELLQINRRQDEVENNDRIDVRGKTIKDEQEVAYESRHAKMPDRIHAKSRQDSGRSGKTKQV
jgi:hypothetical protein